MKSKKQENAANCGTGVQTAKSGEFNRGFYGSGPRKAGSDFEAQAGDYGNASSIAIYGHGRLAACAKIANLVTPLLHAEP